MANVQAKVIIGIEIGRTQRLEDRHDECVDRR